MINKSVMLAAIIGACLAEPPLQHESQSKTSNQAVFSQSVTREDVPLSYKYTAIHTYTTPPTTPLKEANNYHQNNHHYVNYPQNEFAKQPLNPIQYAPVKHVTRVEEPVGTKQSQLYTKVVVPDTNAAEKVNPQYNKKYAEYKENVPNYSNIYEHGYRVPEQVYWGAPQQPTQQILSEQNNGYPTIDSSYSNLKYTQNNQYNIKPKETHLVPKQKLEAPVQIVYAKSMDSDILNFHKMNLDLNGHSIVGPIKRINIDGNDGLLFTIKPQSRMSLDHTITTPPSFKTIQNPTNYFQVATMSSFKAA